MDRHALIAAVEAFCAAPTVERADTALELMLTAELGAHADTPLSAEEHEITRTANLDAIGDEAVLVVAAGRQMAIVGGSAALIKSIHWPAFATKIRPALEYTGEIR